MVKRIRERHIRKSENWPNSALCEPCTTFCPLSCYSRHCRPANSEWNELQFQEWAGTQRPGCATQDILSLLPILIKFGGKGYNVKNHSSTLKNLQPRLNCITSLSNIILIVRRTHLLFNSEHHLLGGQEGDAAVFH